MRSLKAALVLICTPFVSQAEPASRGKALFEGLPGVAGEAIIGNTAVEAGRFPCRNCHGRDGRGGTEGDAPPITWEVLSRPAAGRPAYDSRALARVLLTGEDPAGRRLSRQMPRYDLDDATLAALKQHLSVLPALERRGILPDHIVFAVPIPPDNADAGHRMAEALSAAFAMDVSSTGIFGRQIEIREVSGASDDIIEEVAAQAAAAIGLVPSRTVTVEALSRTGVPVLFPVRPVTGTEDPTLVRSLQASNAGLMRALTLRIAEDIEGTIAVLTSTGADEPIKDIANGLLEGRARLIQPDMAIPNDVAAVLVTSLAEEDFAAYIERLPPEAVLYGPLEIVGRHWSALQNRRIRTVAAFGGAALFRAGRLHDGEPEEIFSELVSRIVTEALVFSGRDLTRSGLISAISRVDLPDIDLRFEDRRISGTDDIVFFYIRPKDHREKTP